MLDAGRDVEAGLPDIAALVAFQSTELFLHGVETSTPLIYHDGCLEVQ
jgi:hypothetical protein